MSKRRVVKKGSNISKYKNLILIAVVIGALFVAANLRFQTGYNMEDSGLFIVPQDMDLSPDQVINVQWTFTEGNLIDEGATVYHIERIVNGETTMLTENMTVPNSDTITYVLDASNYNNEFVLLRLMLYTNTDIYWDDVLYHVLGSSTPTTTTTTTSGYIPPSSSGELDVQGMFVIVIAGFSAALIAMFIFSMIMRRK